MSQAPYDYLTAGDILEIHADQIDIFGGSHGVRDVGQLEAALFRPQTGYYADIFSQAAALWESLSQNHPFVDGNKRTAFAGMHVFLLINGWQITATQNEVWRFLDALYSSNAIRFDVLENWLRHHTAPQP
ncbi:MAG: type II toxin-antitoxin system death-on-curing family toxin [Asticcacaulis sp.]